MKKLLLLAAAAASFSLSSAQAFPELEVFNFQTSPVMETLDPFTSWASEDEVSAYYSNMGFNSDWGVIGFGSTRYAGSISTFIDASTEANSGLVTPKLSLPAEGGMLCFTVANYNPQLSGEVNPLNLYISTEGNTKEDFTDDNLLTSMRVAAYTKNSGLKFTTYTVSLKEYGNKDVYIAFVNRAKNAGLLMLSDVQLVKYRAEISVSNPTLYTTPGTYPVQATFNLQTPVSCKGFTAELFVDGKPHSSYSSTRELSNNYNKYNVAFPDRITLEMNQSVDFSIKVTPNFEGATPIVYAASMACREGFPSVVVEEEGTGVGCGYCPLGAAWMAYLGDTYPDQFIGIAVHGGGFASGVMTAPTYSNQFLGYYNTRSSYPFCMLNRDSSPYPQYFGELFPAFETIRKTNSPLKVAINNTYYYPNDNKVTVEFTPITCFDTKNADYRAAVVLLADGLHGEPTNARWSQSNYYSGYTDAKIKSFVGSSDYMETLAPYYQVYTKATSSLDGGSFDHVAMGIWPDWLGSGCQLNNEMTVASPECYSITFDVPMQTVTDGFGVQDMTKTSVVVMIFDGKTGKIVTAKKMKYADFQQLAAVDTVSAASMSAMQNGDALSLKAAAGTTVELFDINGRLLARHTMTADTDNISVAGLKGLVIVRMSNANDSYVKKFMF